MSEVSSSRLKLFKTEDYWAIWLGLAVVLLSMVFFGAGSSLKPWAVTPGSWHDLAGLRADLGKKLPGIGLVFLFFGAFFTLSMKIMGRDVKQFVVGYTILFAGSLIIFYLAGWSVLKKADLGAPLLALIIGLVIGNFKAVPEWFRTALRTEYYIKTGIVLLGATLPMTLIYTAGPVAFVQATIVSLCTWLTIYLAATRIYKLDPRFGAVLALEGHQVQLQPAGDVRALHQEDREHAVAA